MQVFANTEATLNNNAVTYPNCIPLHHLITAAARQYPDKVAISFHKRTLTYSVLNSTANRIAHFLIAKDIQKGDIIGLALDRSPEMIICLLAIMKAGAAYVPLDPQYPKDRIGFMLDDSAAKMLITSKKHQKSFASGTPELFIEDILEQSALMPEREPDVYSNGENLAYILYTSGSTGKPKGVQIAHHSLVNLMRSLQKAPGITSADKMLAVTTISFDIAGVDIYLPLTVGAEIVLADEVTARDGRALLDVIRQQNITILQATPYTWRMLLEAGWEEYLPLKVFCGGEAMAKDLAKKLLQRCRELWNMYGPTETTIYSIIKRVEDAQEITIGWPIDNTQVYLLDEQLNNLAAGETGEIFIGGAGIAKGYFNRPGLTADKFIPNPFTAIPGDKIYRTGDLGQLKPDGEIIYLGRIDHQVKIRGYRIELGEIEFNLGKQPGIKEAVVIAREDTPGIPRLVAYLVLNPGTSSNNDRVLQNGLKNALFAVLPEYMVPDDFVLLDAIPITPNGKTDRKALPKPDYNLITRTGEYVAPRTENEKLVAGIWEQEMNLNQISILDNFFQLGGRSLVAVKIMTQLENATGKRLPLAALFKYSTIEKLAARLTVNDADITWESLVPIKPNGSKMPLYIVHGAGLNVLLFNALAMNMDNDQPVYGLQAKGLNGIDEPLDVMEEIAANYINEILEHNPIGPYAIAGYSLGGLIAYEMAKQFLALGKEVNMLAMFDTYAGKTQLHHSVFKRKLKSAWFLIKQVAYTPVLFWDDPKRTIEYKSRELKKRLNKIITRLFDKPNKKDVFAAYTNTIHNRSATAQRNYILTPANIRIELFRAKKKTFYMEDFTFLGWKPYAQKGVQVHEIPGEHNTIFAPPNDKQFAKVLQHCLDKAV